MHSTEAKTNWTHPSVRLFAADENPLSKYEAAVRTLVLSSIDAGWNGPPYDPFALAKILKLEVEPKEGVKDARLVPKSGNRAVIEYNPNRPRARVRYSVAHEIAHTLFPDYRSEVRNRLHASEMADDDWQLELLCNIGAAEILMPIGTLEQTRGDTISIDRALELQRNFEVSTEAVLRRLVQISKLPCAMFCAARKSDNTSTFRPNYWLVSGSWEFAHSPWEVIPSDKLLECTAVGYTAKGETKVASKQFVTECVGIPPYPGQRYPRVVGLVAAMSAKTTERIRYLVGNALEPRDSHRTGIVLHVVNNKTPRWGGGFAHQMKKKWPDVQKDFINWAQHDSQHLKLGNIHSFQITNHLHVISMVAQHGFGPSATPRIRYDALTKCLSAASSKAKELAGDIHMPRIGAGQAGGSWPIIEELIDETIVQRGVNVTVYDLANSQPVSEQASLFA